MFWLNLIHIQQVGLTIFYLPSSRLMFYCCLIVAVFMVWSCRKIWRRWCLTYSSRSLKWLGTGASFVVVTSCFRYMDYRKKKSHFTTDVLTERPGSLSEPGSIFSLFWSKRPNGVLLFYWLEKACSAYPRLTGRLTFLFNIMWKGQLRDSPRLALVWLFHK